MKHSIARLCTLGLLAALVTGCSFSMPDALNLPEHVQGDAGEARAPRDGILVRVDTFADKRPSDVVLTFRNRVLSDSTSPGPVVSETLASAFADAGFVPDANAPIVVTGEVKEWAVEARGRSSEATCMLSISLLDPSNSSMYSGEYRGSSRIEGSNLGKREASKALSTALQEAVRQILAEKQIITLLSSY